MTSLLAHSYGRCVVSLLVVVWATGCNAPPPASGEGPRLPLSVDSSNDLSDDSPDDASDDRRTYPVGTLRLVALGDSLTAGLGISSGEAYPARLQERLEKAGYQLEVVNAGVSGDTSAGGLRRLDWSLDGEVAVLIVALGGNDGLRGLPVEQLKSNLSAIITTARDQDVEVVLAGMEAPPNFGTAYTEAFRSTYEQLADEHDVLLVPFLLEGVAGVPELNQPDRIHPNARGAELIAENLWPAVETMARRVDAGLSP